MDKVNGIEMEYIFKQRRHFSETNELRTERKRIIRPDRLRIVGKGRDEERLQEYRPSQKGIEKGSIPKHIGKLNIEIYNRFCYYFETIGTTHLRKYQQNNHKSWLNNSD